MSDISSPNPNPTFCIKWRYICLSTNQMIPFMKIDQGEKCGHLFPFSCDPPYFLSYRKWWRQWNMTVLHVTHIHTHLNIDLRQREHNGAQAVQHTRPHERVHVSVPLLRHPGVDHLRDFHQCLGGIAQPIHLPQENRVRIIRDTVRRTVRV